MDRQSILAKPWSTIDDPEIKGLVAFTFLEERKIALWLARDYYRGEGEIIDGGAFFGGSALSLAAGLRVNAVVPDGQKGSRIHVFDNFTWDSWINKKHLPDDVRFGTSFLNIFHDTVRKYEDLLIIHPGNIEQRSWRHGPIELLFVDCAKSFTANAAIMELFFPHLIPGRSIVNQQDYAIVSRLVWLHASMEYFCDKFEELGIGMSGGTSLFRLIEPITAEDVQSCIAALRTGCLDLAERAMYRYEPGDRRRNCIRKSIEGYNRQPLPIPAE